MTDGIPTDVELTLETRDGRDLLVMKGDITLDNAKLVREKLHELCNEIVRKKIPRFGINLEEVTYLDSIGLGILMGLLNWKKQTEPEIAIYWDKLSNQLKKLLNTTGLITIFEKPDPEGETQ